MASISKLKRGLEILAQHMNPDDDKSCNGLMFVNGSSEITDPTAIAELEKLGWVRKDILEKSEWYLDTN